MMRHLITLILAVIFIILGAVLFNIIPRGLKSGSSPAIMAVKLGDYPLEAEVVSGIAERMRGLSGRASLPEGTGMLFIFDNPSIQGFWMKDMNFPIDIIWIADGSVAGLVSNAPPDDRLTRPVYYSPVPVQYVLEVPAGTAEKFGIGTGTPVTLNSKL